MPQLARSIRASSRGERLAGAEGEAAGAAAGALAGALGAAAELAAGALPVGAGIAGASALRQPADTCWLCCTRHCSEACVPVGTLEHTLM